MMFLAFLFLLSLQLFAICDQDQVKSPHWVVVCGGSYLFSEDAKSWNDASDICGLFGGHLAQIDNMAENYCLLDYAQSQEMKVDYWWHSGNDLENEGVYKQADGGLILWTPIWARRAGSGADEPDSGTSQNCLMVHLLGDIYAGKWWNDPCTTAHYYIC